MEDVYICPGCGKRIPESKWFAHKCFKPQIQCKF